VIAHAAETAEWCANDPRKCGVVFAPPLCTLTSRWGAKSSDIGEGVALSSECDNEPQKSLALQREIFGEPTLVMESGGVWIDPETGETQKKVHVHYRLNTTTKDHDGHEKLRLSRNLLAKIIKSDKSASNSVHPLRWPGSWNRKPGQAPVMAKIIEINDDAEIDLDEALALLKEIAKGLEIDNGERKTTPPPNPEDYEDIEAKTAAALAVIYNDLDYDDWINIGQEIWSGFNGSEEGRRQWHNFSAQRYDKYDERTTEAKWRSFGYGSRTYASLFYRANQIDPSWCDQFKKPRREQINFKGYIPDKPQSLQDQIRECREANNAEYERGEDYNNRSRDMMDDDQSDEDNIDDTSIGSQETPTVRIKSDKLPEMINEAERNLITARIEIYQRGPDLVRIGRFPSKEGQYLQFVPLGKDSIAELMTGAMRWVKFDGRKGDWVATDCPAKIASSYIARKGNWKLPLVCGIIGAPTIRLDGTILDRPGYDPQTRLYYDPQGVKFPAIPENPTLEDARTARDLLFGMVSEVPFAKHDGGAVYRSVFLTTILTALVKPVVGNTPVVIVDAPVKGAGKTRLVNAIGKVVTGDYPSGKVQGNKEEDFDKNLQAAIRGGDQIIFFDNCTIPIKSALLCQMLTQGKVDIRIYGKNENDRTTDSGLVVFTGNNLEVSGDVTRRALTCTLNPDCENPENLEFKTLPPERMAAKYRVEYVAAALTILKAYFVAGRPKQVASLGSFEVWSDIVRSAVMWLGEPDPCLTILDTKEKDPERGRSLALLHQWYRLFRDKRVTVKEVVEAAMRSDYSMGEIRYPNAELKNTILAITENDGDFIDNQIFGLWVRSKADNHIGPYLIKRDGDKHGVASWRVIQTGVDKLEQSDEDIKAKSRWQDALFR
jgi:hypothetical protein